MNYALEQRMRARYGAEAMRVGACRPVDRTSRTIAVAIVCGVASDPPIEVHAVHGARTRRGKRVDENSRGGVHDIVEARAAALVRGEIIICAVERKRATITWIGGSTLRGGWQWCAETDRAEVGQGR